MSEYLENHFRRQLIKDGVDILMTAGNLVPVCEDRNKSPRIAEGSVPTVSVGKVREVGNRFIIYLHLCEKEEIGALTLPYGSCRFEIKEFGELSPGAHFSSTVMLSRSACMFMDQTKKRDLIIAQLEGAATHFARTLDRFAYQAMFTQV